MRNTVQPALPQPLTSWSRNTSVRMLIINQIHAKTSMNHRVERITSPNEKSSMPSSIDLLPHPSITPPG